MIIKFSETSVARNVINKGVIFSREVNIRPRGAVDPVSPSFILKGKEFGELYNYAMFEIERPRFYFIQDIENLGGDLFRLTFELDAIETYKEDILNSNARFRRNMRTGDYFPNTLEDGVLKTISTHNSDVTMSDGTSMILTTVGN